MISRYSFVHLSKLLRPDCSYLIPLHCLPQAAPAASVSTRVEHHMASPSPTAACCPPPPRNSTCESKNTVQGWPYDSHPAFHRRWNKSRSIWLRASCCCGQTHSGADRNFGFWWRQESEEAKLAGWKGLAVLFCRPRFASFRHSLRPHIRRSVDRAFLWMNSSLKTCKGSTCTHTDFRTASLCVFVGLREETEGKPS